MYPEQTEDEWLEAHGYERVTIESLRIDDYIEAFDSPYSYAYVLDKDEGDNPQWVELEWHSSYGNPESYATHISRCYNTELLYRSVEDWSKK